MDEIKEVTVVQQQNDALMELDNDSIEILAAKADKMIECLKKIMIASIKITVPEDWILIGGAPYLQEPGASKVARLFGIGWAIKDGYPIQELDANGYPSFTYRMTFTLGTKSIEADGMRSASDDFFHGSKNNPKSLDEIDIKNVKRAAYTNCLNRGIKGILPGLRNLTLGDLEKAGLDTKKIKGYTFKSGSKGGKTGSAEDSGLVCEACGKGISQNVASYSEGKFGKKLCMDCQKGCDAV